MLDCRECRQPHQRFPVTIIGVGKTGRHSARGANRTKCVGNAWVFVGQDRIMSCKQRLAIKSTAKHAVGVFHKRFVIVLAALVKSGMGVHTSTLVIGDRFEQISRHSHRMQ